MARNSNVGVASIKPILYSLFNISRSFFSFLFFSFLRKYTRPSGIPPFDERGSAEFQENRLISSSRLDRSTTVEDRLTVSGIVLTCQECSFGSPLAALARFNERATRRWRRKAKNVEKKEKKKDTSAWKRCFRKIACRSSFSPLELNQIARERIFHAAFQAWASDRLLSNYFCNLVKSY